MKKPLVSVVMITYAHENFIEQAINGVLMQECDFDIELIIANDCSPDKTDDVLKKIIKNHPNAYWIKYIKHEKNIGMMPNFIFALKEAQGKYIALCEGDDYWIDPLKLQKQVDFLEENPDCSLCFHTNEEVYNNSTGKRIKRPIKRPHDGKFTIKDVIIGGGGFMTTNSMFFHRNHIFELPNWFKESPVGDLPLMLILASKGKIGYLDEVMSAYRVMSSNSWSLTMQDFNNFKAHHYKVIKIWDAFDKWSDYKYSWLVFLKKMINKKYYWKRWLVFKLKI